MLLVENEEEGRGEVANIADGSDCVDEMMDVGEEEDESLVEPLIGMMEEAETRNRNR